MRSSGAVNCSCVSDSSPETHARVATALRRMINTQRVQLLTFVLPGLGRTFDDMFDRSRHGIVFKDRSYGHAPGH